MAIGISVPLFCSNSPSKMENRDKCLHLFLLPLLFFSTSLGQGIEEGGFTNFISSHSDSKNRSKKINASDVGVILETKSWIGNISWSCMKMAADDFYAANPGYSTRLSLHLRDSEGDAFRAVMAGIDLLKTFQARAIIAPQTAAENRFLIEIGEEAHVPIMSFSEMSPRSTKKSPYYIQTSLADSTQAKLISSIVQEFRWRQVVPVVEDSELGNGIVPYLIDAFDEIDVLIPYRSAIPSSATKEQIQEELIKLKSMQIRVFIAHLTSNIGLKFFSVAKEEGMLEEGYVWITTYALTEMALSAADVMQGIVGIKPYVHETKRLQNFTRRWRKKTEPTLFVLWAYDIVWLLAMAAESVSMADSTDGAKLLESIQRTNFEGLMGNFHLVDDRLEFQTFEILNLVGDDQRRIGLWSTKHGMLKKRNCTSNLDVVTWPGATKVVPKGWEWPTKGNKLRIAVPAQPGYSEFLYVEGDALSKNLTVGGFSIEVFKAAMKKLPYVDYELIPYGVDGTGKPNAAYDDILYQVYLQNFDAVVGDVTIIANRSFYVDFTFPYIDSEVAMLVPVKDKLQKGAWAFLKPLDTHLWMASGALFIFTGFVAWFLEHRINQEFRGAPADQFCTALYFTFSSLVFAHRENLLSNLSRIVILVWVFVVFILQSTYTASLSSMLTVEQLQPTVRDLDELIKQGIHIGYMNESFMRNLLKRWKFDESKLIPFNSPEEYHKAFSNGTLSVMLDETPYLKLLLNKHCGKYTMVNPIYRTGGFGFAFPKGSLLVHEVSGAILKLLESNEMLKIEEKLYGNQVCDSNEYNGSTSSLIRLTLRSFWGLFLMTGTASIIALVLYLAFFLKKHREFLSSINSENSLSSKFVKLVKIYDKMDTPNPPKTIIAQEKQAGSSGPESPFSDPNHAVRIIESDQEPET